MRLPRPRLAVSVRGLMLVVLVFGCVLGWKAHRAATQRRSVATIEQAGDECLGGPGITDAGLAQLAGMPRLSTLNLNGSSVTGPGLAHLASLANLEDLRLSSSKVTDAGLGYLAGLSALESLSLSQTAVTDAGLVHLVRFPKLRRLNLDFTTVTDAGLASLRNAPALESLSVRGTTISDRARRAFQAVRPEVNLIGRPRGTRRPPLSEAVSSHSTKKIPPVRVKEAPILKRKPEDPPRRRVASNGGRRSGSGDEKPDSSKCTRWRLETMRNKTVGYLHKM